MRELFFGYILILFGCGDDQPDNKRISLQSRDSLNIYDTLIYPTANEQKLLDIKKIEEILVQQYFDANASLIIQFEETRENINIYAVKRSGDLPTSSTKTYTFIDDKSQNLQFLLPVAYNHYYNIDKEKMIGGIYSYRAFEYYLIYKLSKNFIRRVFDTRDIGSKQIRIGHYKDDECVDYVPDRLEFTYNKEQNEIQFKGLSKIYCEDEADQAGLNKPLKENPITILFNYHQNKWEYNKDKSGYIFW